MSELRPGAMMKLTCPEACGITPFVIGHDVSSNTVGTELRTAQHLITQLSEAHGLDFG